MSGPLSCTPYDSFKPGFWQMLVYRFLVTFFHASGLWRKGRSASGDLATMAFLDKVYWLYKTIHPVRNSAATLYPQIADFLFGTDLPMANLECVIGDRNESEMVFSPKAGPTLTYSPETFDIVKGFGKHGFRFLATACNHSLDLGEAGIQSTIAKLRGDGIDFNGIHQDGAAAPLPSILTIQGVKIAILAVTFGLNARKTPAGQPHMVYVANINAAPDGKNTAIFSTLLRADADFRILHLHWGMEHEFFPRAEQVAMAHHLAELGVDLIVGHHPHVIQPIELYRTKRETGRVVPTFYSLGNLINNYTAEYLCTSLVARVALAVGQSGGRRRALVKSVKTQKVVQRFDEALSVLRLEPVA